MRCFGLCLVFGAMILPAFGYAQSQETLADIRQELQVLSTELQKLTRELSTTGASGNAALGETLIERTDTIESELQRLTSKTERLEQMINHVVTDGTNRIGDLEFRVCELEEGCDLSSLGETKPLGGTAPAQTATTSTPAVSEATSDGPELAVAEKADFDQAKADFDGGDYSSAATRLTAFRKNYPGSPLEAKAGLMLGQALHSQGDVAGAARAWLETFSADQTGPQAPEAVLRLGRALGTLGKQKEACVTLGEVGTRFAGTPQVAAAQTEMTSLGCQ